MILQKAITPQLSDAYFEHNFDRVFGFVMPWATTSWARTPADLIRAHALDFPGTPFSADMPYIDVLRFEATPNLLLEDATGGPDRETQKLTGGPFIDRPPFTGSGFVADPDHIIPVSWMPHTRVPAGTEIYRLGADGSSTYMAYFHSAAWGWIYDDHLQQQREMQPRLLTKLVGGIARVGADVYTADLIDEGANVILVRQDEDAANGGAAADGWAETTPYVWAKTVPTSTVDEYYELDARVRFNGLGFRIVDQVDDGQGGSALMGSYMEHDADLAEGLQLTKMDAGVYEQYLPAELLDEAVVKQTQVPGWPGA